VDGWSVIVQKSEFKAGDKCVYVEIDSVLPDKPEFEFLKNKGGKSLRIKTMKMAGCISQGICFPLSILPDGHYELGDDVTDIIGITKWEPKYDTDEVSSDIKPSKKYPKWLMRFKWFRRLFLSKKECKGFPAFVSKTDETRIQNAPWYLDMPGPWIYTEKVDGQSGTFICAKKPKKFKWMKDQFEYIVCSRNMRLWKKDSSSYWAVSDRYDIENVLKSLIHMLGVDWVCIQGECVGPRVQGNKYHLGQPDLYVFNLITPSGRWNSLSGKNLVETFGMKWVPIVESNIMVLPETVDEMLQEAHGTSQLYDTLREGLVVRSEQGDKSFKAVDPLFLIQHDE